ncbi:hypothetical protein BVI1335_220026 [Burkholderia vietnamiensis]|nr:hypothetical protein BVI1335_220026 [Burkholderia vietnamiensis]
MSFISIIIAHRVTIVCCVRFGVRMSTNRHGEAGVAQVTKQSEESLREPEKSWDCVSAWVNCIRPAARTPAARAHRMPRAPHASCAGVRFAVRILRRRSR